MKGANNNVFTPCYDPLSKPKVKLSWLEPQVRWSP